MGKALALVALAVALTGCQSLTGQPTITVPELIEIMREQNGRGCVYAVGAYPPFGQVKVVAEWGVEPPDYCKPF